MDNTTKEDNQLDELLTELAKNPPSSPQTQSSKQVTIPKTIEKFSDDQELEEFINDNVQKNMNEVFQIIVDLAKDAGDDPDKISALATLVNSNTSLLKILNQRVMKNKDLMVKIKLQKLKADASKFNEVLDTEGSVTTTREAAFKKIFENAQDGEIE